MQNEKDKKETKLLKMQIELTDHIAARVNACETDASNNRMVSYKLNLRLMNFLGL